MLARALVPTAAALLAGAVVAPQALGAAVDSASGTVTFTAGNGEANHVLVEPLDTGVFRVTDFAAPVVANAPCTQITPHRATCPAAGVTLIRVVAGDSDDSVTTRGNVKAELRGGPGTDALDSGGGNDTLYAGGPGSALSFLNDTLHGNGGTDTLYGGTSPAGYSTLDGGPGPDQLLGGPGSDRLYGGPGGDNLAGGSGYDYVHYGEKVTGVTVTLDGVANDGVANEKDNARSDLENLYGSDQADTLTGNLRDNNLYGGDGGDTLSGAGGDDYVDGEGGGDTLNGGDGDDELFPGLQTDTVNGGTGLDFVSYSNRYSSSDTVIVTLDGVANDGAPGENDAVKPDVENARGGAGNDTLTGNASANRLEGNEGGDTLNGGSGDDFLEGELSYTTSGGGQDTLNGGLGRDTLNGGGASDVFNGGGDFDVASYFYRGEPVTASLDGFANDGGPNEKDNLKVDVEGILGGNGSDTLKGNGLANTLTGGAGTDLLQGFGGNDLLRGDETNTYTYYADTFEGGGGTDTVAYDAHYTNVTVDIDGVADDGGSGTEGDNVKVDVENVIGGYGNDTLTGSAQPNALFGGPGNATDTLDGAGAADFLAGGGGGDSHDGAAGADEIDSHGDGTTDTDSCGSDTDRVLADEADTVNADCENVTTVPTNPSLASAARVRTRVAGHEAVRRAKAMRRVIRAVAR